MNYVLYVPLELGDGYNQFMRHPTGFCIDPYCFIIRMLLYVDGAAGGRKDDSTYPKAFRVRVRIIPAKVNVKEVIIIDDGPNDNILASIIVANNTDSSTNKIMSPTEDKSLSADQPQANSLPLRPIDKSLQNKRKKEM